MESRSVLVLGYSSPSALPGSLAAVNASCSPCHSVDLKRSSAGFCSLYNEDSETRREHKRNRHPVSVVILLFSSFFPALFLYDVLSSDPADGVSFGFDGSGRKK